jgi:hypothetical protein
MDDLRLSERAEATRSSDIPAHWPTRSSLPPTLASMVRPVELTPENVSELWSRFDGFHDGLIRSTELRLETKSAQVELG